MLTTQPLRAGKSFSMVRIYYVHWDRVECLAVVEVLRTAGHRVRHQWRSETGEGAKVWNEVKRTPPDVLVICLDRLPTHGRRVAAVTREVRSLRDLPLVFVGEDGPTLDAARAEFPSACFTTAEKLVETVERVGASS
jgi:CheY-like chemotaxis protein